MRTLTFAVLLCVPQMVSALDLALPNGGVRSYEKTETRGTVIATDAFQDGALPHVAPRGDVTQWVWRIEREDFPVTTALDPAKAALVADGYEILLDCVDEDCGGFDFRFALDVAPVPYMHVDLAKYRQISAQKGTGASAQYVSLLSSSSALSGFVQVTEVAAGATRAKPAKPASKPAPVPKIAEIIIPKPLPARGGADGAMPLSQSMAARGAAVLEGVAFASGRATLAEKSLGGLRELGFYLQNNPLTSVALVGHTDSSGGLKGNQALSQQRAEAVRQYLIDAYQIAPERLSAHGVGYLSPRDSNDTPQGRERNRRVEAVLVPIQ